MRKTAIISLLLICSITAKCLAAKSGGKNCNNVFGMDFESFDDYSDHMCMYCFDTMTGIGDAWRNQSIVTQWWMNVTEGNVVWMENDAYVVSYREIRQAFDANSSDSNLLLQQFSNDYYRNVFMQCCNDARRCCEIQMEDDLDDPSESSDHHHQHYCPMQWDGWTCWWPTAAGQNASQVCSDMTLFPLGYLPPKCARSMQTRQCDRNGTWHKIWNSYYYRWMGRSDHSQCAFLGRDARWTYSNLRIGIESVSLVCTCIGLSLFFVYGLYNQFRLQIHVNFFVAIILASTMNILYEMMVPRAHLSQKNTGVLNNPVLCKSFTFFFKNISLMKYFWMMIEGLNFHHMVVFTFDDLNRYKIPIYIIGWIVPNVPMLIYAAVRVARADDMCWTNDVGAFEFIYLIPNYFCFLVNLILFGNLLRVLVVKLLLAHDKLYNHLSGRHHFVRTALILFPIFGVQYVMHMIPPEDPAETCDGGALVWLMMQLIVESSQGFIVTFTLCFLNKEVYSCVRKSIHSTIESTSILTSSNTISGDSSRKSSD